MVVTVTTALLLTGYWRMLSSSIDRQPISRIKRLTTVARTGRLMKRSVNFMAAGSVVLRSRGRIAAGRNRVVDRDRGTVAEFELAGGDDLFAGLYTLEDG